MYQIAICDDEEQELDKIVHMLQSLDKSPDEFAINRFTDAMALLSEVETNAYQPDIILLDIYMPSLTGIETAQKLRDMGNTGSVIFVTSSTDHALDAFGVSASGYLVKPICEKALSDVIAQAVKNLEERQCRYVLLETQEHVRKIALGDIIYCEAQRKKQCIHLQNGEKVLLHMTMAKLCETLCGYREFTKLGVSYVVNLEHIERLDAQMLHLDNGMEIYLPRGSYKSLRKKYFDFYFLDKTLTAIRTL